MTRLRRKPKTQSGAVMTKREAVKKKPYTADEFRRFKRLVEMGESRVQMQRIESRLAWPKFIAEVGKEKCDLMFAVLCGKEPK